MGWLYVTLVGLWAGGAAGLLAALIGSLRAVRRLCAVALPLIQGDAVRWLEELSERRGIDPPRLLVSAHVPGPVLTGLLDPAILLPLDYEQMCDQRAFRGVLVHEISHLVRGDCGWLLLLRLATALGWFQPLLWVLGRQLEASSEEVCDQEAVHEQADPRRYACCLLDLAEQMTSHPLVSGIGVGVTPSQSSLERRVHAILNSRQHASLAFPLPLRAVTLLAGLATVSLGCLLVSAAATSPPTAPDPLSGDPRLEQKVRISIEGLSVGDLLQSLSKKTGVSLESNRETMNDKVMIFGPPRPLRALLADLATLFNDRWEPHQTTSDSPIRYVLTRDEVAQRYEIALANKVAEQLRSQLAAQVHLLSESSAQLAQRPDDDPVRIRLSDLQSRIAIRLYALLSPQQLETLFARGRLPIAFSALTPEQQAPIRSVFQTVIADEQAKAIEESKIGDSPVSELKDLENSGFRFEVTHYPSGSWVVLLLGRSRITIAWTDGRVRWLLPTRGDPYTRERIPADAALPSIQETHASAGGKTWRDRLRLLAEASHTPIMADYYRTQPVTKVGNQPDLNRPEEGSPASEIPQSAPGGSVAASALDTLCETEDYLWWAAGKTLLLRKRDWYLQRLYEVPDSWLQSIITRLNTQGGIPTYADLLRVLELTPQQTDGLNSMYGGMTFQRIQPFLAIVRAAVRNPTALLPSGPSPSEPATAEKISWLTYRALAPNDRHLLQDFLDTYPYPVPSDQAQEFQARLVANLYARAPAPLFINTNQDEAPHPIDPRYRKVQVTILASLTSEHRIWVADQLYLPLSLPDDRRDRTLIEVLP
jgi:beta-lactamase regulating signal transducer with metallopeptidase domain